MAAYIVSLPHDIIILMMQHLSLEGLAALCCTCKLLRDLVSHSKPCYSYDCSSVSPKVEEFGWKDYLRRNPRPSYSLSGCITSWNAGWQARCAHYGLYIGRVSSCPCYDQL